MFSSSSRARLWTVLKRQAPTATCCKINQQLQGSAPVGIRRSQQVMERAVIGRYLSSGGADADPSASECARYLSEISRGDLAGALARHLSPSARKEVAEARERVLAEKGAEAAGEDADAAEPADTTPEDPTPEPSRRDLNLLMFNQSIPFVGFGIMDNAILILAGDAIDTSLGVTLGISTLCAAAIGNIISDLAGVGLGTVIEDFCSKLNIPQPNLSQAQRQLRSVRFANQFGCALGITIGCIIGMFPLLFIDTGKADKLKEEAHLETIFSDMLTEAVELIGAQHTCLYTVVDNEKDSMPSPSATRNKEGAGKYLHGRYISPSGDVMHSTVPVDRGILSRAVKKAKCINVKDAKSHPDFHYESDVLGPMPQEKVNSMLFVPVLDADGHVIAVIKAVNKIGKGSASPHEDRKGGGFTTHDVRTLSALATHVSVTLENLNDDEHKVSLREVIRILKEHEAWSIDRSLTETS